MTLKEASRALYGKLKSVLKESLVSVTNDAKSSKIIVILKNNVSSQIKKLIPDTYDTWKIRVKTAKP